MLSVIISTASSCAATCCTSCLCESCKCVSNCIDSKLARYIYCIQFLLVLILTWILRDYGHEMIDKIPWIARQLIVKQSDQWYSEQMVNRISISSFSYFGCLVILTYFSKSKRNICSKIQNNFWFIKFLFWLFLIAVSFCYPVNIIENYYLVTYFGSSLFLLIQIILFIDFLYLLNQKLLDLDDNNGIYLMSFLTILCYCLSIGLVIYLYQYYVSDNCILSNIFLMSVLLLGGLYSVLTIMPKIEHGSLFPSSIMFLYNLYLCYSSFQSFPSDDDCSYSQSLIENKNSKLILYLGVLSTLGSVIYSAFRTGSIQNLSSNNQISDQKFLSMDQYTDTELGKPDTNVVNYNYSFFHLIFSLASMYIVTLFNGWDQKSELLIGIGWNNVWVKIISSWILSILYIWTLIAPLICKSRDFT